MSDLEYILEEYAECVENDEYVEPEELAKALRLASELIGKRQFRTAICNDCHAIFMDFTGDFKCESCDPLHERRRIKRKENHGKKSTHQPAVRFLFTSPPGDTIKDILDEKDWSYIDFAATLDMTSYRMEMLFDGDIKINEAIAVALAKHLGSTKEFWVNREATYRANLETLKASIAESEANPRAV